MPRHLHDDDKLTLDEIKEWKRSYLPEGYETADQMEKRMNQKVSDAEAIAFARKVGLPIPGEDWDPKIRRGVGGM